MTQVSAWAAFAAGLVSFLSPCVLPLVPAYLSLMSGLSLEELAHGHRSTALRTAGLGSLLFVLGFTTVFVSLGASASFVGRLLDAHYAALSKAAGVVIIVFGLHILGVLRLPWLYAERRYSMGRLSPGLAGSFLMGFAFAFGWTPCIGPILAGILALAAAQETVARGVFLLFVYSMGLGIPFLLTGLGLRRFLSFSKLYRPYILWGERAAGGLLIAVGALILADRFTLLVQLVPGFFKRFAL